MIIRVAAVLVLSIASVQGAYGQQRTVASGGMSLRPELAAEARAREAESAATLAFLGEILYAGDPAKKEGLDYCRSAAELADRGDFRAAIREASKALFLGQKNRRPVLVAHAYRDLATVYLLAGAPDIAISHANAALKEYRAFPVEWTRDSRLRGFKAQVLKVLGDARLRQGAPAEAIGYYADALDADPGALATLLRVAMSNAHLAIGEPAKARQALDKVSGDDARVKSLIARAAANIAMAERNYAKASDLFEQSIQANAGVNRAYERLWSQAGLAEARALNGDRSNAIAAYRQAMDTADLLRGAFESFAVKAGFLDQTQVVFEKAVGLLFDAGLGPEALLASERGRARAMLDQMTGRIEASVEAAAFASPVKTMAQLTELQAALPPRSVLVEYYLLPDRMIVWTVRAGSVKAIALAERRAELEKDIGRFRAAIVQRAPEAAYLAAELYKRLVEPLEIANGESIIVVPHKALHYLPFQALRGPAQYLIETQAIAYAPSASGYLALVRRQRPDSQRVLALGNPTSDEKLPPLPGAEREVESLRTALAGVPVDVLVRDEASHDAFLQRAPGSRVIHIAAHAEVDEIDPIYSRIALAKGSGRTGNLEAHELYRLDLSASRLVVLSACDSGMGRVSGGDEFIGFKQAFLGAGAGGVMVSLWPVDDESTATLVQSLYQGLATAGTAEALRRAQVATLKQAAFGHPFFWAPFTWIGPLN